MMLINIGKHMHKGINKKYSSKKGVNKIQGSLAKWLFMVTLVFSTLFASISVSYAAIDVYEFDNERQEAQYRGLIEELRCPKCQNQNLAGSDAPIAQDLKQKVYDMVKDGRTDTEIRQYMHERYGDFISYKPPVRPSTWILWFFPPALLIVLLIGWFWRTKRRQAQLGHTDGSVNNNGTHDINADMVNHTSHASHTGEVATLSDEEQKALDDLLACHRQTNHHQASHQQSSNQHNDSNHSQQAKQSNLDNMVETGEK